jgi:DNA-binding NtrC family response regulator
MRQGEGDRMEVPSSTSPCVLLIEDDATIRRLGKLGLQMGGFTVDEAPDGKTALSRVDDPTRVYAAIVVDLGLPDLPGEEIVDRVLEVRPETVIVVCTGTRTEEFDPPIVVFPKPYTPTGLATAVKSAIAARKAGA